MEKTAGMVTGTPKWQQDRTYETETEELLEEVYSADEIPVSEIQSEFQRARYYIGLAVDHLIMAANIAERYGQERRIDDLIEKLDDDIQYEMSKIIRQMKERAGA